MGIKGLARLIADAAPAAIKEVELKTYFGRRIAIDASMSLYQFLVAIRHSNQQMTNDAGEATSHLIGFFYRTCKLLEVGIKPIYVFDGKAPVLKGGELAKRKERREDANKKLEEASGADIEKYSKRLVRVTRKHNDDVKTLLRLMGLPIVESPGEAEAQCAELCKEGLVYAIATEDMDGLTFGAPRLIRNLSSGFQEKVKEFELAKALEGMELTQDEFIDLCILLGCDYCGSIRGVGPKTGLDLMRKFRSIESILTEKYKITDFAEVEVDYAEKIREPEPTVDAEVKTEENVDALNDSENVKPENGSGDEENKPINSDSGNDSNDSHPDIKTQKVEDAASEDDDDKDSDTKEGEEEEEEEASTKKKKKGLGKGKKDDAANVPENWLFRGARKLFVDPNVQREAIKESDLKQKDLDEEGLIKFLCEEHGFSEDRVRSGIKRIRAAKGKSAQSRIDTFFRTVPKSPAKDAPSKGKKVEAGKRKAEKSSAAGKRGRKGK